MKLGIEVIASKKMKFPKFALVANYGSVSQDFLYSWEIIQKKYKKEFQFVFSPQHGLMGCEQMNMIESNSYVDQQFGFTVKSLYAESRKPTPAMLEGIDAIVVDLQDVGSKYYTYIYTMALCMKAAQENGKKVIVLDRPNPLGGNQVYGNLTKEFSFVGMYSIPIIHGMTIGELAKLFNEEYGIGCDLEVVKMSGWKRSMDFPQTKMKFQLISPNMPTYDICYVYPGGCLIEGTNISQGRGTTRPFEIIGAPFIEHEKLRKELESYKLPDVHFRSISFKPTFDYFTNEVCHGLFVHPTGKKFNSYLSYIGIIAAIRKMYPSNFAWRQPPYEYENKKLPIDIITGDTEIRLMIERGEKLKTIHQYCEREAKSFLKTRKKYLLY